MGENKCEQSKAFKDEREMVIIYTCSGLTVSSTNEKTPIKRKNLILKSYHISITEMAQELKHSF